MFITTRPIVGASSGIFSGTKQAMRYQRAVIANSRAEYLEGESSVTSIVVALHADKAPQREFAHVLALNQGPRQTRHDDPSPRNAENRGKIDTATGKSSSRTATDENIEVGLPRVSLPDATSPFRC